MCPALDRTCVATREEEEDSEDAFFILVAIGNTNPNPILCIYQRAVIALLYPLGKKKLAKNLRGS